MQVNDIYTMFLLPEMSLTSVISFPIYELTDSEHILMISGGLASNSVRGGCCNATLMQRKNSESHNQKEQNRKQYQPTLSIVFFRFSAVNGGWKKSRVALLYTL